MKKTILFFFLFSATAAAGQNEDLVFDFLKHRVKEVCFSKKEVITYEYREGVIVEKQEYPQKMERHYHYSRVNDLDSVLYYEFAQDKVYTDRTDYRYDQDNRLVKKVHGTDLTSQIVRVDSFLYNSDHLLDSAIWFSNRMETSFRTKRTDALRQYAFFKYKYDAQQRLVEMTSDQAFGANLVRYIYGDDDRISQRVEYKGRLKDGRIFGENQRYATVHFSYNKKGLPTREVTRQYLLEPDGKKKRKGKSTIKRKYKYY
ncbi:MAG: hypothetical protein AAFV25_18960 [Bacteroidota bacterium]